MSLESFPNRIEIHARFWHEMKLTPSRVVGGENFSRELDSKLKSLVYLMRPATTTAWNAWGNALRCETREGATFATSESEFNFFLQRSPHRVLITLSRLSQSKASLHSISMVNNCNLICRSSETRASNRVTGGH